MITVTGFLEYVIFIHSTILCPLRKFKWWLIHVCLLLNNKPLSTLEETHTTTVHFTPYSPVNVSSQKWHEFSLPSGSCRKYKPCELHWNSQRRFHPVFVQYDIASSLQCCHSWPWHAREWYNHSVPSQAALQYTINDASARVGLLFRLYDYKCRCQDVCKVPKVTKLTLATVLSSFIVIGLSKTVSLSLTTDIEKTLLAKNTVLSLPRNSAVCEISEVLKTTLPPREEKREAGRSALSLLCRNSMV